MNPRLFYFNPLFDLELGGYTLDSVAASAKQMSPLFALMGTGRDRVTLDVNVPDEYWEYLSDQGLEYALPVQSGETFSGYSGVPWGWNKGSLDRLQSYGARCDHPNLATVREVNSRQWCARFNAETDTGIPGSRFCASEQGFERTVTLLGDRYPLVVKPAFGGSGYGFIRMRDRGGFSEGERALISTMVKRDGCVVEPWLDRIADLSSSCIVYPDGTAADLRHYRCFVTGHGAFYGVALGHDDPLVNRFKPHLAAAARKAAAALAGAGYAGPAHFDAIIYRDGQTGQERLAAVIEVNARYGMSAIARSLHEKIGKERCIFLRFISRKKCTLPKTYDGVRTLFANDRYDPGNRRGVLVLTPLRVVYGNEYIPPARTAFLCVEEDIEAMWKVDECLRNLG